MSLPPDLIFSILEIIAQYALGEPHDGLDISAMRFTHTRNPRKPHPDLVSCSLISREWRDLTLPHLFHTLELSFSGADSDTPDGLDALNDKLDATTGMCQYVRNLRLSMGTGHAHSCCP